MSYPCVKVIECPMVEGAKRSLEACQACEFHDALKEVRPAGKNSGRPEGYPALYKIFCKIPRGIVVEDFIVEQSGSDKVKQALESATCDIEVKE